MWGKGFLVAAVLVCAAIRPAMAADSGWISLSRSNAYIKSLKAKNELPFKIDCRNDSKVAAAWKPAVRIQSKPNSSNTKWTIIAVVDTKNWQPGNPFDKNRPKWRLVSSKTVKGGAGGTKFQCKLWHA